MKKIKSLVSFLNKKRFYEEAHILKSSSDYRGSHQAPDIEGGSPLHDLNLNGTYPDDVYTHSHYYSMGDGSDNSAWQIVKSAKGKPRTKIKIYRAVPKILTDMDKYNQVLEHKAFIMKHGKLPPGITNWADHSEYYDFLYDEKKRLEKIINHPEYKEEKIKINSGDWVSIDLDYAKQHGRSSLNGEYKILRATVFAMKLYTDGNSILEWAYIA